MEIKEPIRQERKNRVYSEICKGITKKRKPCKNKTANQLGFCYRHMEQQNDEKKEEKKEEKVVLKKEINTKKSKTKEILQGETSIVKLMEKEKEKEKKKKLLKDIMDNKHNWTLLYKKLMNEKIQHLLTFQKSKDKLHRISMNEHDMNTIKYYTLNLIQKDERFANLVYSIDIYNEHIQKISEDKKRISDELSKSSKSISGIKNFCKYYEDKFKYESKNLPILDTKKFRTGTYEKYECVICLEENTEGLVLDCGHKFHVDCISNWFCSQDKLFCPSCRIELKI
jgi:hypothetical protein